MILVNSGYSFYWGHPQIEDQDSVDSAKWEVDEKIIERTEEILLEPHLVEQSEKR